MKLPKLAWQLPLALLATCTVLTSCRLDSETLSIAIENKCDGTILTRIDGGETWNPIDVDQTSGTIASSMDEDGRMAPPLELHVALPTEQEEDPAEWVTHAIDHEDLEIREGESSTGSTFEAVAVVEDDLCP